MKKFSILGVILLLVATASISMAQTTKTISLQMKAVNGSSVSGTAVVAESGAGIKVSVKLSGYAANQGSAGHIHSGTCEKQGPVTNPLSTITADGSGAGSADTTLANVSYASVTDGNHYVQYHEAASPAGKQVSCANIIAASAGAAPAQGGAAAPAAAPATGQGALSNQSSDLSFGLLVALVAVLFTAGAGMVAVRNRAK